MNDYELAKSIIDRYAFTRKRTIEYLDKIGGVLPQYFNPYQKCSFKDYAPTLTTSCNRPSASSAVLIKEKFNMSKKYAIRKLTPVECFRLMGLTIEDAEKCRAVGMSDSALYKQAGNGIVTNCVQLLFEHLYKAQHDDTYTCMDEDIDYENTEAKNKQPLSANVLFSGVGMQDRGIENSNCWNLDVKSTSDIDKDAVVSYAAIHCGLTNDMIENYADYPSREQMVADLEKINLGYDPVKNKTYDWVKVGRKKANDIEKYWLACKLTNNMGDISKIKDLPYADLWTYSFPCFTGNTLVLTDKGYKPIKEINIGDSVITHDNTYHNVSESKCTGNKEIWNVKTMNSDIVECTENHKFYVRKRVRVNTRVKGKAVNYRYFTEPEWVECKDLNKDYYVGYAINNKSIPIEWSGVNYEWSDGRSARHKNSISDKLSDKNFWWLIGRYVADGWQRSQGGIVICCGKHKVEEFENKIKLSGFNYSKTEERTAFRFHIPCKELQAFVTMFGYKAHGKLIPSSIIDMPIEELTAFFEGYMSGDGCFTNNRFKFTTISRELAYGLAQIIAKIYHAPFALYKNKKNPTCVIEGRVCNQHNSYDVVFKKEISKQDKAFYEDGIIWFPINKVVNTHEYQDVYDITVENNHSFTANGCIVHNCTDLSVAGEMKGMIKGKTRSGLLYEVERLLKSTSKDNLPKYLLLENVKNLVGKQFKPQFDEWCDFLESMGYNNYWQVINAKNCGIPQNRERVFVLSIRKDIDTGEFEFPTPFDNGMRLKDVLLEEVDEKYYITNERTDTLINELVESGKLVEFDSEGNEI